MKSSLPPSSLLIGFFAAAFTLWTRGTSLAQETTAKDTILSPWLTNQQFLAAKATIVDQTGEFTRALPFGSALVPATAPATFVSKSIGDHTVVYASGASFTQTFTFKNTGTTTWTGYNLALVPGSDNLGAAATVPIPTTAAGGTVSFKVPLQATKTSGGSPGAAQLAFWNIKDSRGAVVPLSIPAPRNPTSYSSNAVWTAITVDNPVGPGFPHLSTADYNSNNNPYFRIGNGGQCVAHVWGRVHEVTGKSLSTYFTNGADSWIADAQKSGYNVNSVASSNSIAVWQQNTAYHVAYVEKATYNGTTFTGATISEANWTSYNKFADKYDPNNNPASGATSPWWGGGYDGDMKTFTAAQMTTHNGSGYKLVGYIHLP